MRVLLCDDSATVRKKMIGQLRSLIDCDVIEAGNGQMAIDAYRQLHPDLVLMDIMMPVRNGLEATSEIMDMDPNAKIVMLSSVGTKTNLQKALKAGAIDFVQKPCDDGRLKDILTTFLHEEE